MLLVALVGCARPPPRTTLDDEAPRLVNAFFGLDDALPMRAAGLCLAAPGKDGMPVTFTRRVVGVPEPTSFTVTTRAGAKKTPVCATLSPANAPGKRHTVLLIGELGGVDDPPETVTVTGPLALEGGLSATGLASAVTPLEAGPTLVLAMGAAPRNSDCPATSKQVVVVVWAGGVTPRGPGHRKAYRVTTAEGDVTPFALGDQDDSDNYEHLCLDVASPALRVSCSAGVLADPRGDLNPETSVDISAAR